MQRRCHGSCSVKVHKYVCFCEASVAISGQSPNPTTSLFLFFIYSLRSTDPTPPPNSQLPTVASKVKTNVVFLLFDHISHSFTHTTLIQQHLCLLPTATSRPSFRFFSTSLSCDQCQQATLLPSAIAYVECNFTRFLPLFLLSTLSSTHSTFSTVSSGTPWPFPRRVGALIPTLAHCSSFPCSCPELLPSTSIAIIRF